MEELKPYRPINNEPTDNYNMLQEKLTGFESAWQLVHLKCSQLLADVELAQSFTTVRLERRAFLSRPFPTIVLHHMSPFRSLLVD